MGCDVFKYYKIGILENVKSIVVILWKVCVEFGKVKQHETKFILFKGQFRSLVESSLVEIFDFSGLWPLKCFPSYFSCVFKNNVANVQLVYYLSFYQYIKIDWYKLSQLWWEKVIYSLIETKHAWFLSPFILYDLVPVHALVHLVLELAGTIQSCALKGFSIFVNFCCLFIIQFWAKCTCKLWLNYQWAG